MTGWIRTTIVAALAALLLAAPFASIGPAGPDAAAAKRHRGAEAARHREAAPRAAGAVVQSDDGEHDDDLNDGDRADSCELDDNGDEFCAG